MLNLEHGMASVALHVVGGLVKVPDSGYVVLAVLAQELAVVADDHAGVPNRVAMLVVPLQNRGQHDHVEPLGQLQFISFRTIRI